jgi:hypothetical protein
MTHRVVKFLSALAIVPAVLLASGCTSGGDADSDSRPSPATESTAAEVSMDMDSSANGSVLQGH